MQPPGAYLVALGATGSNYQPCPAWLHRCRLLTADWCAGGMWVALCAGEPSGGVAVLKDRLYRSAAGSAQLPPTVAPPPFPFAAGEPAWGCIWDAATYCWMHACRLLCQQAESTVSMVSSSVAIDWFPSCVSLLSQRMSAPLLPLTSSRLPPPPLTASSSSSSLPMASSSLPTASSSRSSRSSRLTRHLTAAAMDSSSSRRMAMGRHRQHPARMRPLTMDSSSSSLSSPPTSLTEEGMAPPSSRSQWRRRQLPTNRCDREATVQRPRPPALLWQPPACSSSSSSLGFTSPRLPLQPLRLPPQCRPSTTQQQRRRCPRMRPSPGRRPQRPRRRSTSRQQRPLCTSRRLLAPARVQPTSPPLGPPRWPAARCPPPLLCRSKARAACPLAQEVVLPDVRAHHLLPARASHHLACPALWIWIQCLHSERLIACMHVPPCLVMMHHNPAFFTGWLTSLPHWPTRCVCLPAYLQLGPPPRPSRRRPRRLPARQRTFPWTKQVGSRTPGSGSPPVTSTPACPLPVVPWLVCSAVLVCLRCITLPPTPPSCPADTSGVRAEYQPVVATIRGLFEVGAKLGGPCSTHSQPSWPMQTATALALLLLLRPLVDTLDCCMCPPGASPPCRAAVPEGGGGTPQQGA